MLHSPPTATSKKGLYNYGRYSNPKMDQAINAAAVETDPEKRKQFVRQALGEHREQVHHIPLHRQFIPWAARANVDLKHYADNAVRAWTMTVR